MGDVVGARELIVAAAREAHALADQTTGAVRKRLLVLAHVTELADRELVTDRSARSSSADRELVAAIRAGEYDGDLLALTGRFREDARERLAVAKPGYDRSAGPPQ